MSLPHDSQLEKANYESAHVEDSSMYSEELAVRGTFILEEERQLGL